ncbi:aminotransferase class-III [Rhodobacteraceae bacterium KLH11]|nr:aminotransferase class-III [Rhodobacteraceae bacterium KLH11]
MAPNGARRGHGDHPALPITIDETVETAIACQQAGANGVHLHVRDQAGRHTLDAGLYRETMAELGRKVPQLDIQITTESAGLFDVQAQFDCLQQVSPDWASVSVREVASAPELAPRLYALCADQGTRVQHILYDAADAELLAHWQEAGVVRADQRDRLLVLGRYATAQQSVPEDMDAFPEGAGPWMVCAFGAQEHLCLHRAAQMGGDLRVGFENSLTGPDGQVWADNAASVAALIDLLRRTAT